MKKYLLFITVAFFGLQAVPEYRVYLTSVKNNTDKNMSITVTNTQGAKLKFALPANTETSIKEHLIKHKTAVRASAIIYMDPIAINGVELKSFSVHQGRKRGNNFIFTSAFYMPITGGLINKVSAINKLPKDKITSISIVLEKSDKKLLPITANLKKERIE